MASLRKAQTDSNRTMAILTLAMTFLVIAFVSALTTGKYPISLADFAQGNRWRSAPLPYSACPAPSWDSSAALASVWPGSSTRRSSGTRWRPRYHRRLFRCQRRCRLRNPFYLRRIAVHHGLRVFRRTSRSLSVPWTHRPFPSKGTLFHCSRGDRGPLPGADISHGAEAHG